MSRLSTDDDPSSPVRNAAGMPDGFRFQSLIDLSFVDVGRQLALCPLRLRPGSSSASAPVANEPEPGGWSRVALLPGDAGRLADTLRKADPARLRAMLAREESFVQRLDDHRVRQSIARLAGLGTFGLFALAPRSARPGEARDPVTSSLFALEPPLPPPAVLRALPVAEAPPPEARPGPPASVLQLRPTIEAPAPAAAPLPAEDGVQALDQAAQAATLRRAAAQGVPFCEECARRAARREELVAA